LEILREYIYSDFLKENGRMDAKNFVRECVLTFPVFVLYFLNLARKSLVISLDSFLELVNLPSVTKQAFSKARKKLSPKVFVLLNEKLLEEYYTDNEFQLWNGFRLIGIDGSKLQVPEKECLKIEFGCAKNQKGSAIAMGNLSCAYDILNNKILDTQLDQYNSSERDFAVEHIEMIKQLYHKTKDLLIFDRGYPSLGFFFYLQQQKIDFLVRACLTTSFKSIVERIQKGETDFIVRLFAKDATGQQVKELKKRVPLLDRKTAYIDIRATVVVLSTGERELLLSSLLDQQLYSPPDLQNLYNRRWGQEENYKWIKGAMELEDFSGYSKHAIEQEVQATMLTANIASMIMEEAQQEIDEEHAQKKLKHKYKINKCIAIGKLKDKLVTALLEGGDMDVFCNSLKNTYKKNLCPVREGRKFDRKWKSKRKHSCTHRGYI
jgi:hypothetical protein